MKPHLTCLAVFLCLAVWPISSQELKITSKDSILQSSWIIGVGYNVVDDSATPFGQDFLDIKNTWNIVPYPATISVGRFFKNGLGVEAVGSYNRYKTGKIIDGEVNAAPRNYYAIDGRLSYDLNRLIGETAWFDPYLSVGAGYSSIGSIGRTTGNAGFGFNTWFNDKWGLNFNTMGKWGLEEGSTKQLQHVAGVVHRFGIEKALSKKGSEKLAMIEALEKENQRVLDSTTAANKKREEEKTLADLLAKENEKARLAAVEKAKIEAENERREKIKKAIEDLGYVYFGLNSSHLSKDYMHLLDKLATILQDNPTLTIQITSHTDSRGMDTYNLWLSERRLRRTIDYLISIGIDGPRLEGSAYGEEQLTNECDDNVPCSESKHRKNRRSQFSIVKW